MRVQVETPLVTFPRSLLTLLIVLSHGRAQCLLLLWSSSSRGHCESRPASRRSINILIGEKGKLARVGKVGALLVPDELKQL